MVRLLIIINNDTVTWGGGGNINKEIAEDKALKACANYSCKIISVFSNGCAMVGGDVNNTEIMVRIDKNPKNPEKMVTEDCIKKYGKGNCWIIHVPPNHPNSSFCSGYDYSSYDQK